MEVTEGVFVGLIEETSNLVQIKELDSIFSRSSP
ncbi:Conserved hypothetical protein [Prochlorococcus marinus str. NATL2A]|uniref:Uncharacterized protein n=2 Tax=Prochlorococcus marinus TaxID=1219 RepID=A7MDV9_PROMT|nr:Hypothetical protein NATL1_15101 [Prochlorococcus marinus str. NATL1A]ABU24047.1 Conserved hypothetical protein [Prochlorococcus marinus str. NATL2A]